MKAIAFSPEGKRLSLVDRPEPRVKEGDDIKVRVLKVGVCGTDREHIAEGDVQPPEGLSDLVLGHENLGRVVDVGADVKRVKPGGLVVFTVRRGCDKCLPCIMGRSDMCLTGRFKERGLLGLDGFQSEYAVDKERYATIVPEGLEPVGVLLEPMSVVEKAVHEGLKIQSARLPGAAGGPDWLYGKKVLVAGLGSIGLLATLVFRLRGAEVFGLDIVDEGTARTKWLSEIDGTYVDGRKVKPDNVDAAVGPMDMVLEAAGVPSLQFNLLDALERNGIYTVIGIPSEGKCGSTITVNGAELMNQLVRKNQAVYGSVSSAPGHFRWAIDDLILAESRWKGHVRKLINREFVYGDFKDALTRHEEDEIKSVIKWAV